MSTTMRRGWASWEVTANQVYPRDSSLRTGRGDIKSGCRRLGRQGGECGRPCGRAWPLELCALGCATAGSLWSRRVASQVELGV